jgi:hypothetical protein
MDTRTHPFATSSRTSRAPVPGTLAAALAAEKGRIVVSFAGQGAPCLDELAALYASSPTVRRLVQIADRVITEESAHPTIRWSGLFAEPMRLVTWVTTPASRPTSEALTQSHTSHPIVFLTQIGRWASLLEQGLDRAVDAGAVIGADGFGFAPDRGTWFKIPQIGRVVIETQQPLPVEAYVSNRSGGSLIIVDPTTNRTSGALLVALAAA